MNRLEHKRHGKQLRARRTRIAIQTPRQIPRLSISVSNANISAQIIDDTAAKTLVSATTTGQDLKISMTAKADWVGHQIGQKAKKKGITKVVFDRGAKKYHGRVKQLADSARSEGLKF